MTETGRHQQPHALVTVKRAQARLNHKRVSTTSASQPTTNIDASPITIISTQIHTQRLLFYFNHATRAKTHTNKTGHKSQNEKRQTATLSMSVNTDPEKTKKSYARTFIPFINLHNNKPHHTPYQNPSARNHQRILTSFIFIHCTGTWRGGVF